MSQIKPRFKHNCPCCEFLGRFLQYDLWYHEAPKGFEVLTTVIARFSSEGPDYASGMPTAENVLAGKKPVDTKGRTVEWDSASLALGAALLALRARKEVDALVASCREEEEANSLIDVEPID